MFEPVKEGLGNFMQGFYRNLAPTTTPMHEFVQRGFPYCFAWAPSRMIDKTEEMLAAWQKNDTNQAPSTPPKMPVVLVAMAKDYAPIGGEWGMQIADSTEIIVKGKNGKKDRYFEMRMVAGEVRAQIAIIAQDEPTAKSIAAQFLLHMASPASRGFYVEYDLGGDGEKHPFPVQFESPDNPAMNIDTGANNLTILAIDLSLKCSIPIFKAPADGDPNDGEGVPGTDYIGGFPLVREVDIYDPAEDRKVDTNTGKH